MMRAAHAFLCVLLMACSASDRNTDHGTAGSTTTTTSAPAQQPPDARVLQDIVLGEPLTGKRVYITKEPLAGGTAIPTWGRAQTVPAKFAHAWFVFVDDQPEANWEHRCRYVFIDAADHHRFDVVQGRTPPDDLSSMRLIYPSK